MTLLPRTLLKLRITRGVGPCIGSDDAWLLGDGVATLLPETVLDGTLEVLLCINGVLRSEVARSYRSDISSASKWAVYGGITILFLSSM